MPISFIYTLMLALCPSAVMAAGAAEPVPMPYTTVDAPADASFDPPMLPDDVVEEALQQKHPLNGEQILKSRKFEADRERAMKREILPVVPISSTSVIDPDTMTERTQSGALTPPILRMRVGYSTNLVFRDANGEPYKVKPIDFAAFRAYKLKQVSESVLAVYATESYEASNISILADGIDMPLVIHLTNGEREVDYMRTFLIQRLSPATQEAMDLKRGATKALDIPVVNDPALTSFLDGIPPSEAQTVPVLEDGASAWWYKNKLILRTKMLLLSPDGTPLHGGGGLKVYEIHNPVETLLMSDAGRETVLHLVLDSVRKYANVGEGR